MFRCWDVDTRASISEFGTGFFLLFFFFVFFLFLGMWFRVSIVPVCKVGSTQRKTLQPLHEVPSIPHKKLESSGGSNAYTCSNLAWSTLWVGWWRWWRHGHRLCTCRPAQAAALISTWAKQARKQRHRHFQAMGRGSQTGQRPKGNGRQRQPWAMIGENRQLVTNEPVEFEK